MTTADTESTIVRQILQTALGTSLEGIENPDRDQFPEWDSLSHVEIVFMLEEQFDVRFSEEDMAAMHSLGDIVALLREKHAP